MITKLIDNYEKLMNTMNTMFNLNFYMSGFSWVLGNDKVLTKSGSINRILVVRRQLIYLNNTTVKFLDPVYYNVCSICLVCPINKLELMVTE